jgi:hypothetical protein
MLRPIGRNCSIANWQTEKNLDLRIKAMKLKQ